MARHGAQSVLFDAPTQLPNGLVYRPNFITEEEERKILEVIRKLPLKQPKYDEYVARRRIIGFGWGFDFEKKRLVPGPSLPAFLEPVQRKIAKWLDIPKERVVEALINEYTPGTALGWHRDNETFEEIIGVSLEGWCRMRLRPIAHIGDKSKVVPLELEPRSAYIMQKDVRWKWQHSVAPTRTLRYSITFRTLPKNIPTPKPLRHTTRRVAEA